jgi:hypothetical protein
MTFIIQTMIVPPTIYYNILNSQLYQNIVKTGKLYKYIIIKKIIYYCI